MQAEVAVPLPVPTTFHYRVPKPLEPHAAAGKRAWVPFGSRRLLGMIVSLPDRSPFKTLKPVTEILDDEPLLDPHMLELTRWVARTYHCGWGEAIAAALPAPLRRGKGGMTPRGEETAPHPAATSPLRLTVEQQLAFEAILPAVLEPRHEVFLLHGVTGSGKTEVYLQAIQEALDRGRSAIVLVPEISLTPQAIHRFEGRFGRGIVAVLHSAMLESRRYQEWRRIHSGEARVVVGARSAVFAPVRALGLIVVDEEHEPSYKQEDAPRYHAREVAIERGRLAGAPVVLGSATPALETYARAAEGKIRLLELKGRIDEVPLPQVEVVDMREERATAHRYSIFSRALERALEETLQGKQQAILFLNRRGFATFVHCRHCGHVMKCPSCQISLTYHIASKQLLCHHCGATVPMPEICPKCRSEYVRFQGIGTEKVESELARHFPQAAIGRMDSDAMRQRGAHAKILGEFSEHKLDVLVGTQMLAKGLDFPKVTLVGVISADTAMNLPDFRSAERTFNLLTQVGGRAGRGRMPGKVIVQTYAPHHYAIQAAKTHDYLSFYRQEIAVRRELALPPFSRLATLTVRSQSQGKAQQFAEQAAAACRRTLPREVQVTGPAPAPIPKLRRQYRWQILLKSARPELFGDPLAKALRSLHAPRGCYLAVDVDPL